MDDESKTRFANESDPEKGMTYDIPTDGLFQAHWSNGNIRYEWYYKNGQRADGESKGWHSNGQLKQVITWKNGKRHGLYTSWYKNGQKKEEKTYKDGKKEGVGTIWYKNGQIQEEVEFN